MLAPGLELALVARHIDDDRRVGGHHNLLLSVLVLERQDLAVARSHDLLDIAVGHGAGRLQVPTEDRYKLVVDGLIENKKPRTLEELYALPQETQITRLICIEGWSVIGKWTGTPLRQFLRRIGAYLTAKYVHFVCAEATRFRSICPPPCMRRRR
jgi:hypothetical protein